MKKTVTIFTFICLVFLPFKTFPQTCSSTGCKPVSGTQTPRALETGFSTIPIVDMDFDALPVGPTSVAAIRDAFPGSTLANITIETDPSESTTYDIQDSGNAIAGVDSSGSVAIIGSNGSYQKTDKMIIDLSEPTTEFGFVIGDWDGDIDVSVFDGQNLISSLQIATGGFGILRETETPFDRIEIEAVSTSAEPDPSWVVTRLFVPTRVLSEIGGMTIPNVAMDFDALPVGPTSVSAIRDAFPGSILSDIIFDTDPFGTETYDEQIVGNALAGIDASGTLAVIGSGDTYQNTDDVTIALDEATTEFGFGLGDWTWPTFDVSVFAGNDLISTRRINNPDNGTENRYFVRETTPFDRVKLRVVRIPNPELNPTWVINFLAIPRIPPNIPPEAKSIPTLSAWGLVLLAGAMMFVTVSHRRNAT